MSASPSVMNTLLVKFHTLFLPELSEVQLVWDDLPATSPATPAGIKVALCHHQTLTFVLRVLNTVASKMRTCFSAE